MDNKSLLFNTPSPVSSRFRSQMRCFGPDFRIINSVRLLSHILEIATQTRKAYGFLIHRSRIVQQRFGVGLFNRGAMEDLLLRLAEGLAKSTRHVLVPQTASVGSAFDVAGLASARLSTWHYQLGSG